MLKKRKQIKKVHKLDKVQVTPSYFTQQLKKKKKLNKHMMEEILSDNESITEGAIDQEQMEIEQNQDLLDNETADEKRIRLAKQILQTTKIQVSKKSKKLQELEDEQSQKQDSDDDYVAVHRDKDDLVSKKLEEKLLHKKKQIFHLYADKVKASHDKKTEFKTITLKGHKKCITCIEISPCKNFIYSASKDQSIIKWKIATFEKIFFSKGKKKDPNGHYDEILCMALSHDGKYLITSGKDRMIKQWDTSSTELVHTYKGHKDTVNSLKFGHLSYQFCSVSSDRTLKVWDMAQKAYIETLFGHKNEIFSLDKISEVNFISTGFDKQVVLWKTEQQSQLIFESGHDYSIDSVKTIDFEHFLTASQDGSIAYWNQKKKKPLLTAQNVHGKDNWITAMGNQFNTDLFATGSYNNQICIFKIDIERKKLEQLFTIQHQGIVNDIKFAEDCSFVAFCQGDEHRLGRWITQKAKNCIKIIKF